jgi:hypothetical protein
MVRSIKGIVLLSILFLVACSSPTPASQYGYPLDTRTGIPDIDNVLAAVARGDAEDVRALIQYTHAPCTWKEGLGGPPKCREGEAEGTMLEVLPFLGSEGSFIRRNEIANWSGIDADALYAVFGVADSARHEEYYPPGEYVALFLQKDDQNGVALHITDGKIVRVDTIFTESPDPFKGFIEQGSLDTSKVILAPKPR